MSGGARVRVGCAVVPADGRLVGGHCRSVQTTQFGVLARRPRAKQPLLYCTISIQSFSPLTTDLHLQICCFGSTVFVSFAHQRPCLRRKGSAFCILYACLPFTTQPSKKKPVYTQQTALLTHDTPQLLSTHTQTTHKQLPLPLQQHKAPPKPTHPPLVEWQLLLQKAYQHGLAGGGQTSSVWICVCVHPVSLLPVVICSSVVAHHTWLCC